MGFCISGLNKSFRNLRIYREFDISFEENRISSVIGPSGCGKTTLLNMIGGTVKADSGKFRGFAGKKISYIFQEPRLLPWKTVGGNIKFVLKNLYPEPERSRIAERFMEIVNLADFADYYPKELSGGMKQRVAVARAFAFPSDILLMDEPFKTLDLKLRADLMNSFKELWLKNRRTVIFVTHDVDEALLLGHYIYVFNGPPVSIKGIFETEGALEGRNISEPWALKLKQKICSLLNDDFGA